MLEYDSASASEDEVDDDAEDDDDFQDDIHGDSDDDSHGFAEEDDGASERMGVQGQPAVSKTMIVNIDNEEISVLCPAAAQFAATVDSSLQRKETRSQWWGPKIEACLRQVNPSLADDRWKKIRLADQYQVLQECVLMPLLLGNEEAGFPGAFMLERNVKGAIVSNLMQPGSITNKLSELEFYMQQHYDPAFSLGKGSPFAEGHGAVLNALQRLVAKTQDM